MICSRSWLKFLAAIKLECMIPQKMFLYLHIKKKKKNLKIWIIIHKTQFPGMFSYSNIYVKLLARFLVHSWCSKILILPLAFSLRFFLSLLIIQKNLKNTLDLYATHPLKIHSSYLLLITLHLWKDHFQSSLSLLFLHLIFNDNVFRFCLHSHLFPVYTSSLAICSLSIVSSTSCVPMIYF